MAIVLIDATSNSLTISWNDIPGTVKYVLQYRVDKDDDDSFVTIADQLTTTQARKKNLDGNHRYFFRVGPLREGDEVPKTWVSHTDAFAVLQQDIHRRVAPRVSLAGSNQSLLVQWDKGNDTDTYELQMREYAGGVSWSTVAPSLSGTQVIKKHLTSTRGYQFRVRVTGGDEVFSEPSDPIVALGLSKGIQSLIKTTSLLKQTSKIDLANGLGGKEFILFYASASWCGPCRQYTPTLIQWYQQSSGVEVIFLSADHDEKSMLSYYSKMPWLAVEYDDDAREALLAYIKVTGIPRLVVLDGKTGRTLVDNAVGQKLDVTQWRRLAGTQK